MKALLCRAFAGLDDLAVEDVESPVPGPGEVRLDVHAAGANFADTLLVAGTYQRRPPLPFAPGFEAAGEVVETGAGAGRVRVGERVVAVAGHGAYAEEMVVPEAAVVALPDEIDFVTAAALPVTYSTDHYALARRARLAPGETLLVHGAAGSIGLAAVELGGLMGASVIGAVGSDDRKELVRRHGARHVINYAREPVRETVLELTGGKGADVVLDPVGGDAFDQSVRCTAWGGRLLVVGFAAGRIPAFKTNLALLKGFAVVGVNWPAYVEREAAHFREDMETLLAWCAEGRLRPEIAGVHPLERTVAALEDLRARRVRGKLVIALR